MPATRPSPAVKPVRAVNIKETAKAIAKERIAKEDIAKTLAKFVRLGLLTRADVDECLRMFAADFPFAVQLALADTIHLHVKVDDVAALPHAAIEALGTRAENHKPGYVKYPFASGVNLIFSSIDVAQDDQIPGLPKRPKPFLDHLGIDLRGEQPRVRRVFDGVAVVAAKLRWGLASQGGNGKAVFCCHVQVAEKRWVYPTLGGICTSPIEFAFGPLIIDTSKMGCDLRPIDPNHPAAAQAVSCCADPDAASGHAAASPAASSATTNAYYDARDLARFGDMGAFAAPLMAKFFDYYNAVTGADGALTKREKALIALAVAHSKQCPYCIDAYTSQCLATGSTPDQMHEAVHVAAALGAGIDLVHGVQMQKALRAKGAIA